MFQNRKEAVIILSVIAVLVAGTAAYYLWPEQGADAERPPSLVINVPKLQGLNKLSERNADDPVCIPGMLSVDPEYDGYFAPPGDPAAPRPNRKDPKTPPAIGTHLYYATETMSVQKLINSIVPVEGGQVLFAFYSPGVEATAGSVAKEKGWHLFPDSVSESTSVDAGGEATHGIEDPTQYQINPYEGFVVFSCKPTEIHNVKSETDIPEGMPVHLIEIDEGWVLVPEFFSYLSNVSDTTEERRRAALFSLRMDLKPKAIWLQEGKGFSFPASTPNDQVAAKFAPDAEIPVEYRMIWVKLGEPARAQRVGTPVPTAAEIAALAAVREAGLTGDEAAAYIETYTSTYEEEIAFAASDGSEVTDEELAEAIANSEAAAEAAAEAANNDVRTDPSAERQPVEPPQRPGEPPTRPGGEGPGGVPVRPPSNIPPGQVQNLIATKHGCTAVDLVWNEVFDSVGYNIAYSVKDDEDATINYVPVGSVTATLIEGLEIDTTYEFLISAENADGQEGEWSEPASATTGGCSSGPSRPTTPSRPSRPGGETLPTRPTRPGGETLPTRPTRPGGELPVSTLRAVENLKAIPCHKSVKLTWDPVSSDDAVDGYMIHYITRSTDDRSEQYIEGASVEDYIILNLENGAEYFFVMRTRYEGSSEGPETEVVSATPSEEDAGNCPVKFGPTVRPTAPVQP